MNLVAHKFMMALSLVTKCVHTAMEVFWPEKAVDLQHVHKLGHINGSYTECQPGCACLYKEGINIHKDSKDRHGYVTAPAGEYSGR
jgi:hypothetical protein